MLGLLLSASIWNTTVAVGGMPLLMVLTLASAVTPGEPSALITTTGVVRSSGSSLSRRSISWPSITGIIRSSRMRSGRS